jgi:ATP-dependent helicase HrpA
LTAARWLLEELRLSLFAQAIGAAEKVSIERIKKALD